MFTKQSFKLFAFLIIFLKNDWLNFCHFAASWLSPTEGGGSFRPESAPGPWINGFEDKWEFVRLYLLSEKKYEARQKMIKFPQYPSFLRRRFLLNSLRNFNPFGEDLMSLPVGHTSECWTFGLGRSCELWEKI